MKIASRYRLMENDESLGQFSGHPDIGVEAGWMLAMLSARFVAFEALG